MPPAISRLELMEREILALQKVIAELRTLAATAGPDQAAAIREHIADTSERLELLRMKRDRAKAMGVIQALPPEERQAHIDALAKLDSYVRNDQEVQTSIRYLLQAASLLR